MIAVHMTEAEFAALGLSTDIPVPAPVVQHITPLPALPDLAAMMPRSQVFQVVAALLALSEAVYGGAVVKHDAIARTWDIRVGDATGYRVDVSEHLATV